MNSRRYSSFFSGLGSLALLVGLSACGGSVAASPPPSGAVPCAYFVAAADDSTGKPFNGVTTQPLVPSEPVTNGFGFTTCQGTFIAGTKTVARTLVFFFSTDNLKVGQLVFARVSYKELDPSVNCPSATCVPPVWIGSGDYVKIEELVGNRLRFSFNEAIVSAPGDNRSLSSGNLSIRGDITVTLSTL